MGRRKEIKNTLAELAQKERGTSDETLNDDGSVPEVSGSSSKNDFKSISEEKPPRVVGLKDLNMTVSQSLRLNCQVRGRPIPRINWYKDGTSLIPSSHVNVTYYRRNSTIEINSLELKDGGLYECRATSVTGKTAKISAQINVWKLYIPTTTDPDKSFPIKKCSVDAYCLNGGQCYFIEHLGEHMCECAAGFKGARCEMKEVSAIGIKSYVCGFNVGYSSYYC
ncbi:hypothetical protein RUM44_013176 [Polyplax serrata]|uniref:Uncharacterized protein n=1 Tax=Polyplax serrata TaxID=468196 RepID=A0ABR1BFC2_POLSC